jgi:hypothetical protein
MFPNLLLLSTGFLTLVAPALALPELPYAPTQLVPAQNGSLVYVFSPQPSSSQFSLSWLNTSDAVDAGTNTVIQSETLPFLSDSNSRAFIALPPDDDGFSVLVGDCNASPQNLGLWRYAQNNTGMGTWKTLLLSTTDDSLSVNYLSAGFTFSPTTLAGDASLYVFGGMCPNAQTSNTTTWTSDATYSNTMLTMAEGEAASGDGAYQLSLTGARAPPVAEAGLTITALVPTISNSSDGTVSQQQNFVLLGGHTQHAFINMSQLAIFSLPQASWAFVDAEQTGTDVEPRSGHTAVLSEDGSQIIVLGGWVGDIDTPAQPPLVVLDVAQQYGGEGTWGWTVPATKSSPFSSGQGIYGHGATMLPGGIMMVTGGYDIVPSGSKRKRGVANNLAFLNTTNFEWSTAYTNPNAASFKSPSADASSSGLRTSTKAGLGAGLGLGLVAVAIVAICWVLYSRKLKAKRALREKELREQALGVEGFHTPLPPGEDDQRYPGRRSASWNAAQEEKIETVNDPFPWAPVIRSGQLDPKRLSMEHKQDNSARLAERTGVQMEVPSPTRGLRKALGTRGSHTYHPFNQHPPFGPGGVFRIEEEDEGSHSGSLRRAKTPKLGPDLSGNEEAQNLENSTEEDDQSDAAAQRRKEVEGWVEDWQSAAESMTVSRSASLAQSRTYSNLSHSRYPPVTGEATGRGSPEKSDRTGSNLSEQSLVSTSSFHRSATGSLSRNLSKRSVSTGYSLFSGAAAAMSRFGYGFQGNGTRTGGARPTRAPSNRSVSLTIDTNRLEDSGGGPDTISPVRSGWGPSERDNHMPLNLGQGPQIQGDYGTLPSSPSKEKYPGLGASAGRKGFNILGSVKRVLSGTAGVDVRDRVATLESNSAQSSPTRYTRQPEMSETTPFWRSKQGAKDWAADTTGSSDTAVSTAVRRKPVAGPAVNSDQATPEHDEDWDIESAVQQRVVQVMFTVPKEKLRVVNADALSLLSSNRSEVDQDEDKEREQIKRMSSVREGDEEYHDNEDDDYTTARSGKGKGRAL